MSDSALEYFGIPPPHRLQKDVFAKLDHAGHHGAAPVEHHARRQHLFVARFADHLLDQREDLLDARLDHAGQRLLAQQSADRGRPARHLDLGVGVGQQLLRVAVLDLDVLGVLGRRSQRHSDVAVDEIAGNRITAVWRIAPLVKIATSVVPAPMSTSTTPSSRSSSVSTAWLDANGFSTTGRPPGRSGART